MKKGGVKAIRVSRRKNNKEFEKNEAACCKNLKDTHKYEGSPPNIKEFEDFRVMGKHLENRKIKLIRKPVGLAI